MEEYSANVANGSDVAQADTPGSGSGSHIEVSSREALARSLAKRAKARRRALGLSLRELAELVAGVTPVEMAGWEQRLPHKYRSAESRWEDALRVPKGWLRDTSIDTPVPETITKGAKGHSPAVKAVKAGIKESPLMSSTVEIEFGSVAFEIVGFCQRAPSIEGSDIQTLSLVKRRMVTLLSCRAGVFGREFSTLEAVAEQFYRTANYVCVLERKLREHLSTAAHAHTTPAMDQLKQMAQQHLPCTVTKFDDLMRRELGGNLSIVDANRFYRHVLGLPCFTIVQLGTEEVILPDGLTIDHLEATREVSVGLIRLAGAARIDMVSKRLTQSLEKEVDIPTATRWVETLGGFEWIDQGSGWFWLGPSLPSKVSAAAVKVLVAAGCPVHIMDMYRAVAPMPQESIMQVPVEVLATLLARHNGIAREGEDHLTLATSVKLENVLTPRELDVHAALVSFGGEASMAQLSDALVDKGQMSYACLATILSSSPMIVRLKSSSYGIRGLRTDRLGNGRPLSKALRKQLAARATARREYLGLTLAAVAQRTGVLTPSHILVLERCLPSDVMPGEDKLEDALEVPRGWLRDITNDAAITSDARPAPAVVASFAADTVAREITDTFHTYVCRRRGRGDLTTLTRNVEIATWLCGLHGREQARKDSVSERFALSESILISAVQMVKTILTANGGGIELPVLDRFARDCQVALPMLAEEFDRRYRARLGGDLSIVDLARTCRTVFGKDVFQMALSSRGMMVQSVAGSPDRFAMVQKLAVAMTRATGGAQIDWLSGALSRMSGEKVARVDVVRWVTLLDGFQWLSQPDGWFCLGFESEPIASARQTVLKVLAIAPGAVDLTDLMGAVWRLRTYHREPELSRTGFIEMPESVFARLVLLFPEVRKVDSRDGAIRFRLRRLIKPEQLLSTSEMKVYRLLSRHDGVVASATLAKEPGELSETQRPADIVARCALVTTVERGIYRLRGYPLDPVAYAKACEERAYDPLARREMGEDALAA